MSYTASTSLPPYWGLSDSVSEIAPPRLPSISLNFLAAIASSGLHHHTHATYELLRLEVRSAGTGGYATVEIGRNADNELVAVKRSKILSQPFGLRDKAAFEHHFNQLVLELRILSHERLRKHPNVTNILGLLIDDRSVHPDLSLVLEYSAFGTLDSFLGDRPTSLLVIERVDLIQQVAKGLGAVHELKICHGDVKTRNTLVFQDGEKWIAKLSDFGQSIVSGKGDFANSPLRCPFGTRLLNAPEIRKGLFVGNSLFNIDAAMSTDTFSFGLLAWEVLKNGKSFVQSSWIEDCGNDANVESMEDYLNRLPPNQLCKEALKFLEDVQMDQQVKVHLSMVFEGTLDDNPEQRIPMSRLSEMLDLSLETQDSRLNKEKSILDASTSTLSMPSWSTRESLYEVWESGLKNTTKIGAPFTLDLIPISVQARILSELKLLADCEAITDDIRGHAAMTVSECYTLGFGAAHNSNMVVDWLLKAAELGSLKAASWYLRVCEATRIAPKPNSFTSVEILENHLSQLTTTEDYLAMRVQKFATSIMHQARESVASARTIPDFPFSYRIGIFNTWEIDELLPLHLWAWIGDEAQVITILQHTDVNAVSANGFNAAHYACFGGQLSILRILLEYNISVSTAGLHGITPLHLGIFFAKDDLHEAVTLLMDHGVMKDAKTTAAVIWEDHDITLLGTPLHWAVLTRNKDLVRRLLPYTDPAGCLSIAVRHFFWEIAEELLEHFRSESWVPEKSLYLVSIRRPVSHWIAHGDAYLTAIDKTVQVCQKYHIHNFDEDGYTNLMHCINAARTEADLHLIEALLDVLSTAVIKQRIDGDSSALLFAISRASDNEKWLEILRKLTKSYSIEELQQVALFTASYLHMAVAGNSVVGARVLLERGVNVNQPTFDEYKNSPLQLCMQISGSTTMFRLLLDYGADLQVKDRTGADLLQLRLTGPQYDTALLDLVSNQALIELSSDLLHTMLENTIGLRKEHRKDAREGFRYLLTSKNIDKFINDVDGKGITLIQKASYYLHLDSVRLLLEAGADANIPLDNGVTQIVPLQIACSVGRLMWLSAGLDPATGDSPFIHNKRDMAMEVATELLHWYQARRYGEFSGISDLHIAACIMSPIEVQKCLANGYDPKAKGRWPGMDLEATPKELMDDDWESEIKALDFLIQAFRPYEFEDSKGLRHQSELPLDFDDPTISAYDASRAEISAILLSSQNSSLQE